MEFLFRPIEEIDPVKGIDRTHVIVAPKIVSSSQRAHSVCDDELDCKDNQQKSEKKLDN